MDLSKKKQEYMERLTNDHQVIGALAIDQRGALKRMIGKHQSEPVTSTQIEDFKKIVSSELTPFTSSILLDPEYGLPAAKVRDEKNGLLLAYEKTGYDSSTPGRLPDLLTGWSVKRIKEAGADACKFLLYYDVDEPNEINDQKKAFIERIGSECLAEDFPFFLELVSYDGNDSDTSTKAYALKKPHKVIDMMKEFSDPRYGVDVLKVEVPVNMKYVEGFADGEIAYTKEEAAHYFKKQSEVSNLPFIFLSAGVSAKLFQDTLCFAKEAGSTFNGVLCGRASWANGVESFIAEGEDNARKWMQETGRKNVEELNAVLEATATPIRF
ncbi:tagatose-bisphosphate aldolase [Marinilactibacillus psychrotolerans]|uniref:Tagatose 1,6-diphosphate aldolase n=1 Tax=Marinilactibacillus psychrotolerans TaxID=191770 RepID=A0ABW8ULS2_9LACT